MEVSELRPLSVRGREARLVATYYSDCATTHSAPLRAPAQAVQRRQDELARAALRPVVEEHVDEHGNRASIHRCDAVLSP